MDPKTDYNPDPAHPGTPLEPDELSPSPPEFQAPGQEARQESEAPKAHPTSALSSTPSHTRGPVSSGKHPTSELHIKPKGRR